MRIVANYMCELKPTIVDDFQDMDVNSTTPAYGEPGATEVVQPKHSYNLRSRGKIVDLY